MPITMETTEMMATDAYLLFLDAYVCIRVCALGLFIGLFIHWLAVKRVGYVWWAMLGFVEDAAEVFADDADGKELASAEEEDDDDEGGEALDVIAYGYGLDEEVEGV